MSDTQPSITQFMRRKRQFDDDHDTNGRRSKKIVSGPSFDVESSEFYKHTDPELPDPLRLQQILIWCLKRQVNNQSLNAQIGLSGLDSTEDITARNIAKVIEQEVIDKLQNDEINVNWWSISRSMSSQGEEAPKQTLALIKAPNPANEKNASKIKQVSAKIRHLENELKEWNKALAKIKEDLQSRPITRQPMVSVSTGKALACRNALIKTFENAKSETSLVQRLYNSLNQIEAIADAGTAFESRIFALNRMTPRDDLKPVLRALSRSTR